MPVSDKQFGEFCTEVMEQLATLRSTSERISARCDRIDKSLDAIDHALRGNGKPGLIVDVELLKQESAAKSWWLKTVAVAAIGALISAVVTFVRGLM